MSALQGQPRRPSRQTHGDRAWHDAGKDTLGELSKLLGERAKAIAGAVDVDAVHDMRTATRRLRTAITLHADAAPKKRRAMVEDELKRIASRLGAVRDLDVLLETLDGATAALPGADGSDDLRPLRKAWRSERKIGARRLKAELGRPRFRRAIGAASQLADDRDTSTDGNPAAHAVTERVATRAPGLIWDAFGKVLAFEVDPNPADPAAIHEMRIAAKKLRYTLEAFADALEPGQTMIQEVTALQDDAGSMHDAIVAGDRARSTLPPRKLARRQRRAIAAFADSQGRRAEDLRPLISKRLRTIRSRDFRDSLGRAVAEMGHVRA